MSISLSVPPSTFQTPTRSCLFICSARKEEAGRAFYRPNMEGGDMGETMELCMVGKIGIGKSEIVKK
jgi:hypothetical protein